MKSFITTTFARAGGWLAGARRVRAAMMLLLAVIMVPQKAAAADDYESNYVGRDFSLNYSGSTQYVLFRVTYWDDYGTDEGWCDNDGLVVKASKNGGASYEEIGRIKTSSSGGLTMTGSLSNAWSESTKYTKICIPKWVLPRQWLNCNIKIICEGYWTDYDGESHGKKSTSWSFTSSFTHTVRQIYWSGSPYIAANGTVTVPYSFGGSCNTDGETHICTRIDGGYNGNIGYKYPAGGYPAGSYTFNLSSIGKNMRSQFSIEPYHEFTHNNDKDAGNGTKYYCTYAGAVTMYPLPLATISEPVFSQLNHNVTLNWTADYTQHYGNGKWVIYRNGTKIATVPQVQNQDTYTYIDQNADDNSADKFPYESNVKYFIYFVGNGWDESTQLSELKSNEVSVNTTRKVPVSNLNAESRDDRIVFTWTSDGYPEGWGNMFNIYIDNVLAYTLIPSDSETKFKWEHRTTDVHSDRQSSNQDSETFDGNHYTEEPLNACAPHNYLIEGVIGNKVLSNAEPLNNRAIGNGTLFYTFDATKGAYPGTVKLSWHVNRQGSTASKTYIVDRRRTEKDDEPWVTLFRTSSNEDYLMYTDDTPLPGVFYDYRVTVIDKCDDGTEIPNETTDIGFAQTTGTMSGRITFGATGSSVANVDVEARRTATSGDVEAQYHAMRFTDTNGAVTWTYPSETYATDKFAQGDFTIQMWVKPEVLAEAKIVRLNGEGCYIGMNASGQLTLVNNEDVYTFKNVALTAKQYNHVVVTRSGKSVTASVVRTSSSGTNTLKSSTLSVEGDLALTGATQLSLGHFKGYVDEFRFWTKVLTKAEILENFDHLLVGNEKQLETYWTFDEGLRTQFFDYSRDGTVYHQHHGKMDSNAEPSNQTPTQLKLKAKTDQDGNFIIQGVPFQGEGTTYAVIPTLGIHQFNPTQQLRFVGNNSLVHNGTDFTDISSFPVRGTIRYANTDYPVEGVNFYVDGQICAKDGTPITTNAYGEYEISVPIGQHYITVAKQGHVFADDGRYPADPEKVGTLVNYNDAVSNLDFEDVTLVTVAGRVTGGKIEEEKPLGFGQSVNNIGQATITLGIDGYRLNVVRNVSGTTVSYDSNPDNLAISSPTEDVKSEAYRQGGDVDAVKKVIIKTDPKTGEFAALLPPIDYRVKSIEIESNQDITFDGLPIIYANDPLDTKTDSLMLENGTKKEFEYVAKLIQSYYTEPVLEVTQKDRNDGSFGEQTYTYIDTKTQENTKLTLYTAADGSPVSYTYGFPIFQQMKQYTFNVRGYETYVNNDDAQNPVVYEVPLQNVPVTFTNQMGTGQGVVIDATQTAESDDNDGDLAGEAIADQLMLDENGQGQYQWQAGFPNITSPYTRTLAATYQHNDKSYTWTGVNTPNSLSGIVIGALPTGSNFVTAGPDKVEMIIRDPAGSGSSAFWETGQSVARTETQTITVNNETEMMTHTEIGFELTSLTAAGTGIGIILGVIETNKSKVDIDVGVTTEYEHVSADTKVLTTSTTKRISTSGEPEYVGAQGDVFIGQSTNIVFGNARSVGFKKNVTSGDIELLKFDNYVTGQEFATHFQYTQNYIENVLIPNLTALRNSILSNGVDEQGLIYNTTLTEDDANYGAAGTYTTAKPATGVKDLYTDMVQYYNQQIANWESQLAWNEEVKVTAISDRRKWLDANQSFDSGTFIDAEVSTEGTVGKTTSNTFNTSLIAGGGTSVSIFGQDVDISLQNTTTAGSQWESSSETTQTTTTGYSLVEVGDDDALSVDVFRAPDGMGAIFVTRGGQTTCPYEGEQRTKYFEPGKHVLATATMQIEVPKIAVEDAANRAVGVPAGKKASYNLLLTNESETAEDCYFDLFAIDETNTEGAKLTINGEPFGNGRAVLVPAGGTVRMNLELAQNNTGGLIYEDIAIVLASQCQKDPASTWEVIGDTVIISAEFVPTSTDVALRMDNRVVNTSTKGMLPLTVTGYDPNYEGLKYIAVQYQGVGETAWHDARKYVLTKQDIVNQIDELLPTDGIINLNFDMTNGSVFPDRTYKFRAISARTYGTGEVTATSQEIQVVKDMSRPKPLGQPQPTDGILSVGDELSILFNEAILNGELTKDANFRVTGVLNGSKVAHETALEMENTALAAATEGNINLANKDFSIDMWVKAEGAGTLLSHGTGRQKLTVGVDADSKLMVKIGDQTYTSINTVPQNQWAFLTLSMTQDAKLSASVATDATTTTLFSDKEAMVYEGNGPLAVGQQMTGAMHELLLWDEARDVTTALQQRSLTKTPSTQGLIGYWKMNEGEGRSIRDYARNRHMTMPAETWYLNNKNKAVALDGSHYMAINTSQLQTFEGDDYALEFWMRGNMQGAEAQLVQVGDVALWTNAQGVLQLTGKGAYKPADQMMSFATTSGNILDNAWHHIAVNILRQGAAAVYVDGKRVLTTNAANVGTIASDKLLLGVRRTTFSAESAEYTYGCPFKGEVDEIRVWGATMNADMIAKNRKVRLTGSEAGLMAYYPFEKNTLDKYNQPITLGTDSCLTDSTVKAQLLTLNSQPSTLNYTDEAPALRTKPTETNVSFSYVASDSKVVINIDEDPATIEGCTLNFSVHAVRDENGNYSEPAVWSAFINCNTLLWKDGALAADLQAGTAATVTTSVVNKGGTMQMWTLSGMPAWLQASTESGTTNPLAETKVTFTVTESTPIGKYEETIYLTGTDGIEVPLTIRVTVKGKEPDWAVNENDFEGSMILIGTLEILGVPSQDSNDIVAAFVDGECRGLARPEYNQRYDRHLLSMDIYGNNDELNKDVTFKAYDASTGVTYPVIVTSEDVNFQVDRMYGKPAVPVILSAVDIQEQFTALAKGWNWLSLNVTLDEMTVPVVFKDLSASTALVKSKKISMMNYDGTWYGQSIGLNNSEMYKVQMSQADNLHIMGKKVDPQATPITLIPGWNWVAYNGSQTISITDAMADMDPRDGDVVKGQRGTAMYDGYEWFGGLKSLVPGQGYMIQTTDARTFRYPKAVSAAGARMMTSYDEAPSHFSPVDCHLYPSNMTVVAQVLVNGVPAAGIEVGVFDKEECRAAAVTDADGLAVLTIPGDGHATMMFRVYDGSLTAACNETLPYENDAIQGSRRSPFIVSVSPTGIEPLTQQDSDSMLYDLQGRRVYRQTEGVQRSTLKKGVYIEDGQKRVKK